MLTDYDLILSKVVKYCAFQDRCLSEVETKIDSFAVSHDEKQAILDYLTKEKFLEFYLYI